MTLSVDVGGTFTDLVWWDGAEIRVGKTSSTPDQSEGVVEQPQSAKEEKCFLPQSQSTMNFLFFYISFLYFTIFPHSRMSLWWEACTMVKQQSFDNQGGRIVLLDEIIFQKYLVKVYFAIFL